MVKIERLQEVCLMVISQLEAYKEKYDELKDSLQLDGTEVIWCKGWRAPHEPIFFEEMPKPIRPPLMSCAMLAAFIRS